jgi:hypothetical protein
VSDADEAHGPDRLRLSVRADADGRFEMPPLPLALVDSGAGSEVEAFADGFLGQAESVDRTQVKEGDVILELEQGIAIRGQVVGPDGVPVAGAEARIDDDIRATTDASGRFVLTLLRDENRRIVVCRTRRRPARPGHNDNDAIQRITATALGPFDADTDVGVVHLSQGRRLRGRVVDRSGAAVRGANVILGIPGVGLDSDTSDAEGRFEFADVGADAYDVGAYEYSNAPRTVIGRHAGVTGVRAGDAEVLVALTGATSVVIRFFDELRHEPIAVRDIRLRGVLHGTKEPHEEQHWNGPLEAVRFELQKPGSFDVSIASPGFEPQTVENVESFVDRESTLDVVLRKTSK